MTGRQNGFTYLGLLLAIALLGLGLAAASEVWSTVARRQHMEQLEWVGQQYMQAIGSYYESSPGGAKTYPRTLLDLVEDRRYPFVLRHLRQVYVNPFTDKPDWEFVTVPDGGIRGVRTSVNREGDTGLVAKEFSYAPINEARPQGSSVVANP